MSDWIRVSRKKRCPICDYADWCLISKDEAVAICGRTESDKRCGDAGWLHRLKSLDLRSPGRFTRTLRIKDDGQPQTDFGTKMGEYKKALTQRRLQWLADKLRLSITSLEQFSPGWSSQQQAYAFPMRYANGTISGIHLRKPDGRKLSISGSKHGLFVPDSFQKPQKTLFLSEGLTDTVALTQLGMPAIGRPSCNSGFHLVKELTKVYQVRELVIVADGDKPGQAGAEHLAGMMACYVPSVKIITPPAGIKDVRGWVQNGLSRSDLESLVSAAPTCRVKVFRKEVDRG